MKPPEHCTGIEDVRGAIDDLDRRIVCLVGQRARYVSAAARFKTGEASVRAPERQKVMLEERRQWAEEENLSPEVIGEMYQDLAFFIDRKLND